MDDFEKFYNYSLRFLSYRPRSEKELKDKLKRKKVDYSIVNQIVQKLKEKNFLNDEEFTKWWIEQRTTFRPRGSNLIKRELRDKGIPNEIINFAVSNFPASRGEQFPISNEKEMIKKLIEKKMARVRNLPKEKVYQKLGGFLARRGFDFETIKSVIDEVYKERV